MTKEWKRVTINLTHEEYADLRLVARVRRESVSAFLCYLFGQYLRNNPLMLELLSDARDITPAKPS